jgi:hypothetical protein
MLALMLLIILLGSVVLTGPPQHGNRRVCLTDGQP